MRSPIVQFIQARYAAAHGVTAPVNFPRYISRMHSTQRGAALGYRLAGEGPLFLERYLDAPVEAVLRESLGRSVPRSAIVEIGSLAGNSCTALIALWHRASHELSAEGEIGIAVLTQPLRAMLRRLGITLHELARADGDRLGAERAAWGSYYERDPVVCAGSLPESRRLLSRFMARRHCEKGSA